MSYDLHLFCPRPRADLLKDARASYGEDDAPAGTPPPAVAERMRAVAAALRVGDPALTASSGEQTDGGFLELDGPPSTGLQILLGPRTASVTVPYWHRGEDAQAAWSAAWSALGVLEREGGFRTYDPQLDRVLDLATDRDDVTGAYTVGVQRMASVTPIPRPVPMPAPPPPPRRPWWKFW